MKPINSPWINRNSLHKVSKDTFLIILLYDGGGRRWEGFYLFPKNKKEQYQYFCDLERKGFIKEEHNEDKVWASYRREKRGLLLLYILGGMAVMLLPADDYFVVAAGLSGIWLLAFIIPVLYKIMNPFSKRRDKAIELVNQIAKEQEDSLED